MAKRIDPFFHADGYPSRSEKGTAIGTPRIPDGVVELRVHGVAGGTPQQNLGDPHPIKINGDDEAGVYRRRAELNSGPERTVEAYNWSSINSGRTARAFWIALFPFAAANFAGWLLPDDMFDSRDPDADPENRWDRWRSRQLAQACVRGISLVVTAVAMLGMAMISVDIVGLQCGARGSCNAGWFGWFESVSSLSFLSGHPTRFAVMGTAVPLAALGILWYIGRRSTSYERYGTGHADAAELGEAPAGDYIDTIRLDEIGFWQSPDTVNIQGWLHLSVALATLGAMLAATMRVLAPTSVFHTTFLWLGIVDAVWLGAVGLIVLLVGRMRQLPRSRLRQSAARVWMPERAWLLVSVPGVLIVMIALLGWGADGARPASPVLEPIRNGLIVATLIGLALLVLLGFLVGAWRVLVIIGGVGLFWYGVLLMNSRWVGGAQPGVSDDRFWLSFGTSWQWVIAEAVIAGAFIVVIWMRSARSHDQDPSRKHGLLWIIASAGVVCGLAMAADARAGEDSWLVFGFAAGIVVAYVFGALSIRAHLGRTDPLLDAPVPGAMRSGTAFVMASVALGSILAISAASTVWIARALGDAIAHTGQVIVGETEIAYPAEAGWFALAAFAGIFVLVAIIILRLGSLRLFRWTSDVVDAISSRYDGESPPARSDGAGSDENADAEWKLGFASKSRTLRLFANIVDDVDWMITAGVMAMLSVVVASAIARFREGFPAGRLEDAVALASGVLVLVLFAVFLVLRSAREDRRIRATIGILWDVMSFFPRRFHPLAPPCYSERTVIEVRNRLIEYARADDAKGTVLLAHSQGTMITTAALLSLRNPDSLLGTSDHLKPSGEELDNLVFVTYGCMLERLFRRAWPDQLRKSDLVDLKARLEFDSVAYREWKAQQVAGEHPIPSTRPHWMNFGRYTDFLGGRVFGDLQAMPSPTQDKPDQDERDDDIMFGDPTRRWRYPGETTSARAWLHSFNYESDAEDPRLREHVWACAQEFNES